MLLGLDMILEIAQSIEDFEEDIRKIEKGKKYGKMKNDGAKNDKWKRKHLLKNESVMAEEQLSWNEAVSKVARVVEDVCKDYDKQGHPYYSKFLREAFQRLLKG